MRASQKIEMYVTGIKLKYEIPSENYLNDLDVIKTLKDMGELTFDKPVTFFVGENGIGKSTLTEAIAVNCGCNPEGGSKNYRFSTKKTHSDLCDYLTVIKTGLRPNYTYFLRAESFYNTVSYMDYLDGGSETFFDSLQNKTSQRSLHNMSHGEAFLNMIGSLGKNGLYIFDEPEAALSPNGLMKLIVIIDDLVKKNSQFIISTHSPILMAFPDAEIFEITPGQIAQVPYKETTHYTLTKRFLNDPEKMLKFLLSDED